MALTEAQRRIINTETANRYGLIDRSRQQDKIAQLSAEIENEAANLRKSAGEIDFLLQEGKSFGTDAKTTASIKESANRIRRMARQIGIELGF